MAVSFPNTTFNLLAKRSLVPLIEQKVLLIGQKVAAGSATSGDLISNIQNDSSENALFGENSMIAAMVRAYKTLNIDTQLDVISLDDDGGAVDATGTITFTGGATENGTFIVNVGSRTNHSFSINVIDGDTVTDIGDALVTAVTADARSPVSAANVAGVVTFTAINGGTVGNNIGLEITGVVAGVTLALTAMASGATDPSLTNIFDVLGSERYQTIVAPFEYGTTFLTSFLDARFNVTDDVLDGVGIMTSSDTFALLQAAGDAENSQSLVLFGNRLVAESLYQGSALFELDHIQSSLFAAIRSLRFTDGANYSRFIVASGSGRDSFGGADLATLPYANAPIPGLPIIDQAREFTRQETEDLRDAGVALIGNNRTRTSTIMDQVVTTRKTDVAGNPELTFKFLNGVDTGSVFREFFVLNNRSRFA